MTSVLIVEDQRMPRENMEHLVEDSGRYRRVASLSTAEMALAQCARHTVELVLMDVCTKGSRDGIDVAAEIKARYPETKVIIITSMVEESYLKRAKAAGAESFWYKDVSPESLLEVMDRTMAGESLYPDRTPETRLGQVSSTQLTPREIEVLRLVCEGLEYEEIAAELGISSYNKIVVFIDRSPAECYNKFRMLWIGGTSPTAKTVFGRLQPQLLC